jgi:hypothetical protein
MSVLQQTTLRRSGGRETISAEVRVAAAARRPRNRHQGKAIHGRRVLNDYLCSHYSASPAPEKGSKAKLLQFRLHPAQVPDDK